jgi:hypothetical protein
MSIQQNRASVDTSTRNQLHDPPNGVLRRPGRDEDKKINGYQNWLAVRSLSLLVCAALIGTRFRRHDHSLAVELVRRPMGGLAHLTAVVYLAALGKLAAQLGRRLAAHDAHARHELDRLGVCSGEVGHIECSRVAVLCRHGDAGIRACL